MKPTKQYIADKALILFNQKGFVNVRLQHIADAAFVSVGHLAYHFKTKDALILNLYDALKKKQETLLMEFRVLPLFEDIALLLHNMYALQQEYRFFYLDTLEVLRTFPEIAAGHRALMGFQRQQIAFMLEFNVSRSAFAAEKYSGQFADLTGLFCMAMDSGLHYAFVANSEEEGEKAYSRNLWAVLKNLFTDTGEMEFRQLMSIGIEYPQQ